MALTLSERESDLNEGALGELLKLRFRSARLFSEKIDVVDWTICFTAKYLIDSLQRKVGADNNSPESKHFRTLFKWRVIESAT